MKEKWRSLSERERLLILVASSLAGIFVLVQFVAAPVIAWRTEKSAALARAKENHELVMKASAFGKPANANADRATPVRNAVTATAGEVGVRLNFVNARPDGAVDAAAEAVEPDAFYRWISALEEKYAISVLSADIARDSVARDKIRAQLTFTRAGG